MKIEQYIERMTPKKSKSKNNVSKEIREIDKLSEIEICDEIIENNFRIGRHKYVDKDDILDYRKQLIKSLK